MLNSWNNFFNFPFPKEQLTADHVVGMLLYARTRDSLQPDGFDKNILGNRMMTQTLDLEQEPLAIAKQLDDIAEEIFGPKQ